jgi:hypothetical protein
LGKLADQTMKNLFAIARIQERGGHLSFWVKPAKRMALPERACAPSLANRRTEKSR